MQNKSKKLWIKVFGSAFLTGWIVFFLISSDNKTDDSATLSSFETKNESDKTKFLKQQIISPYIPEHVDFCGEIPPLNDPEVYERLDKEVIINSHLHGSMLLLLKKSQRYFPIIEKILKEERIPDDMKYLCMAESALSHAISPAGAVGFWQLMESTGKEYGLQIDNQVDERYHIEKATKAACRYLKDSKNKFGNWTMAAAAYNAGNNGMNRQVEKQNEAIYYDLHLNQETSRYIFRILALKLIIENPTHFGFYLDESEKYMPFHYKRIKINDSVTDWVEFARSLGVSYKTLKYHNYWITGKELKINDQKEFHILLPQD